MRKLELIKVSFYRTIFAWILSPFAMWIILYIRTGIADHIEFFINYEYLFIMIKYFFILYFFIFMFSYSEDHSKKIYKLILIIMLAFSYWIVKYKVN
ncbi:hypothetical protein QP020_09450 [Gallibacterium anatis]|uniref:hypothetical protein n=1 Tax=Gallibacterium anatis TaxID=750 RepID=UPI00254F87DD|nr:hypothetical protein [Gallibacterium anatis]WIM83985.1 hypothetical protein QP020_09450 [Gallibacterium anatis]